MRRYWWFFLMAFAPCLALGAWASWDQVRRGNLDEVNLRYGFRDLAEDSGRKALTAVLERIRAADGIPVLAAVPGVDCAFAIGADGSIVVPGPVATASPGYGGGDALLLEARRLEYVAEDPAAAERAYRELTRRAGQPELVAEAQAGLVGVLGKLGRREAAIAALGASVAAGTIAPDQAAALALVCADGGMPDALIPTVFLLWERGVPNRDLQARLQETLASHRAALPSGLAERFDRHRDAIRHAERVRELGLGLDQASRRWLAERVADGVGGWYRSAMGGVLGIGGARRLGCRIDQQALQGLIEADLARQPGLAVLARTYREHHGRSLVAAVPEVRIETPWGQPLPLRTPALADAGGGGMSAQGVALLLVGLALAMTLAGFAFLYRTARRDLDSMQRRSDFVSNVSHELKTPLSLVKMFGEMLSLDYARDESERRKWYGIIVQESTRLSQLITNVLDFAALEKGTKSYASEPVDLAALVQGLLDTYRPQLDRDGFTVASALSPVIVRGDQDALAQVVINLLTNAMKYSPERKDIRIAVHHDGAEAVLAVTDHGIGIAPEHRQRIFEPFFRIETGLTRETRGAGIGLSLVRSIVLAHHGCVGVDSALGSGSTFTVRLPVMA